MAWYRSGTVTAAAGQNVITGTGTQWANNVFGIAPGQMIFVPGAGQVFIYEILSVDSDTKIRVTRNIATAITNSEYAIVTTVSNSMSDLARRTAVQLDLYQQLLEDWQNITTGTGDVTIIAPDGSTVVIPSLSDLTAWVNDSKTWFNDNSGGLPLLFSWWEENRDHIPDGTAPRDGQELSRALFPDAWAEAQAKGLVITEAEWQADPLKRMRWSSGNGTTTFRLPDENGKSPGSVGAPVRRGDGAKSNGVTGTIQMDAIRNITGSMPNSQVLNGNIATGAFSDNTNTLTPYPAYSATNAGQGKITFNASLAENVLVADENRMLNATGCYVIKLAGSSFNEGQINALELATQITLLTTRVTTLEADAFTASRISNAPWINLTLTNGWSINSSYRGVYRKVLGMVFVEATLVAGTVSDGTIITTFPAGYRPLTALICPAVGPISTAGNVLPRVAITPNGECKIYGIYSSAGSTTTLLLSFAVQ
ncbi:TPA: phage tail protein [Yersinia enterocolitica]|nr:phage tail protein [Yersinia enterocolitica]